MTIETGLLEQSYIKEETTFAITPADALSATDGIRHLELSLSSKKNREASPEKRGTPDETQSLPRRQSQNFDLSSIMWEPSGTLGTISNIGKLLEGGVGSKAVASLNTTIASGGSATGATLTSGTGATVGGLVVVTMPSGVREVTRLKTVAGAVVTWDSLSVTPGAAGAAVVCGVSYVLTNNITKSYAIYKYFNAGGFKQCCYGSVVDRIQISFDGSKETMLAFSGPSASYADSTVGTVQAKPGSHTTVGAPVAGLTGNVYIDTAAFPLIAAQIEIQNQVVLRNDEIGTSVATAIAGRNNRRQVTCSLTFFLEDTNLFTKANAVTKAVVRILIGQTNGSMLGCVMPSVEFEIPDIPQGTGPLRVTISGRAYATSGNDQIFLGEL